MSYSLNAISKRLPREKTSHLVGFPIVNINSLMLSLLEEFGWRHLEVLSFVAPTTVIWYH